MSHQKIYTSCYHVVNDVNDEVSSSFSKIVEQIKVIQEVVLSEIFKLTQLFDRLSQNVHHVMKKNH